MDTELFELCKEVYKRTGWNNTQMRFVAKPLTEDYRILHKSQLHALNESVYEDNLIYNSTFLYDSDYLLEKLGEDDRHIGMFTQSVNWAASYQRTGLLIQEASNTPLKALLKLTVALDDAGELNHA